MQARLARFSSYYPWPFSQQACYRWSSSANGGAPPHAEVTPQGLAPSPPGHSTSAKREASPIRRGFRFITSARNYRPCLRRILYWLIPRLQPNSISFKIGQRLILSCSSHK